MSKPLVLALDLATTSGWALGRVGERCQHGSIRFCKRSKCSRAEIFLEAITWLQDTFRNQKPDIVVFEKPIPFFGGFSNFGTIRLLYGLCAFAEGLSFAHGIFRVTDINVQEVRKFVIGFKPKAKEAKTEIIKSVTAWGYIPQDDNAADAIALFIYFSKTYSNGGLNDE